MLLDGRVVSCRHDGRVAVWDPAAPDADPVELGIEDDAVWAVAVLPDGRLLMITAEGLVRLWDPAAPGTGPLEVGTDPDGVQAVAVLPDGRVVSGGAAGRVRLWDPTAPGAGAVLMSGHHPASGRQLSRCPGCFTCTDVGNGPTGDDVVGSAAARGV